MFTRVATEPYHCQFEHDSFLCSQRTVDGVRWSTLHPCCFTPEKDPVPIVQEVSWVPGPVWTGAENLAPTRIQSLDRPACNESLCRLSCIYLCVYSVSPTKPGITLIILTPMKILQQNINRSTFVV